MTDEQRVNVHTTTGWKRPLLLVAGSLSLAAGIVGIFVPLWPTTCFLLIATLCFSKSSSRLYGWMMTNRFFGRHLTQYRQEGRLDPGVCRGSMLLLWPSMALSLALMKPPLWVWLAMAGIGLAVTAHLRSLVRRHSDPGLGDASRLTRGS